MAGTWSYHASWSPFLQIFAFVSCLLVCLLVIHISFSLMDCSSLQTAASSPRHLARSTSHEKEINGHFVFQYMYLYVIACV